MRSLLSSLLFRGAEPLVTLVAVAAVVGTASLGPRVRDRLVGRESPEDRLVTAAGGGDPAQFEQALADGASVRWHDAQGVTALMMAAATGHVGRVERLIALGAEVNAADRGSETPLMFAATSDHPDVALLLLRDGADAGRTDRVGDTALDRARLNRADRAAAVLSAWGRREE